MPRIRLELSEVRAGALPPACLVCGRSAEVYFARTFSCRPPSTAALSLLLLCICWPIALTLFFVERAQAKQMTVHVPLCQRHRSYWLWRAFWITIPLLVMLAVVIALGALSLSNMIAENAYYLVLFSTIFLLMVWGVTAWILSRTGIRAVEITVDEITLEPVSTAFAEMVRDQRIAKKGETGPVWDDYDPYPRERARGDGGKE